MSVPNPNKFARGTAKFNAIAAAQGEPAAVAAWQAAIDAYRNQTPLDDSFWSVFGTQITPDPLGAPLESLNKTAVNTILSFLKSPWVIVITAIVIFSVMGGWAWLGKKVFKA